MKELAFIENMLNDLAPFVRDQYANRQHVDVSRKTSPTDLVTAVDIEVQRRTMERLDAAFPGDALMAEELNMTDPPADLNARCWVMDPIDGTGNFVRGLFPMFGISLAFVQGGKVLAGAVSLPVLDLLFVAEKGGGAFRNGARMKVSDIDAVEAARIEIEFSSRALRERTICAVRPLFLNTGNLRAHGSAVAGLCSVANGDMEAYVHAALSPWDYAAGILIIEEAGGVVTRWDGGPIRLFDGKTTLLASNKALHARFLASLTNS